MMLTAMEVARAEGALVNEAAPLEQGARRLVGCEYPGFETVQAKVAEAPVRHVLYPDASEPLATIDR